MKKNLNQAPDIETERLLLRPHRLEDFSDCVEMWSEPAVSRYTIGEPSSAQRTWVRMLAYAGHWVLLGFGYWAVEEKSSGKFIGELGFADFKRDLHTSLEGVPELGWALATRAHNKGYATEALRAVVTWGDAHLEADRTVCLIRPENVASLRVAAKIDFHEIFRVEKNTTPEIVLARKRSI
ncbi:MAG: GNAT family N-acetyltransferase [Bdellovibrionales bacterium]|nr:GNAT family N-acetyltransferase [Bdellovibrionales bacterium]